MTKMYPREIIRSMASRAASPLLVTSALVTVQMLFGLNYVFSKVIVGIFPPLAWADIRVICSAILMLGINIIFARKMPKADRKFFLPLIVYSVLGIVCTQSFFLLGLHYTTSTNSAILNTLIPVFTLVVVTIQGNETLTAQRAIGFFFAFIGVLVIRKVEDFSLSNKTLVGDLFILMNALSTALFLVFSKKFLQKYDRFWATTWLFIYGSVGLSILSAPDWMHFRMPEMTPLLWGCAAFGVISTLLTYFLSNWALAHTQSSHVALFIYLQPVVASFLAWLWLDEKITIRVVAACLLISLGVLAALLPKNALKFKRA